MPAVRTRGSAGDPQIGQAPGELAAVQAFVNTRDIEAGTDELTSPQALDRWLASAGLTGQFGDPAPPSGPAELELAIDLRESLRAVLRTHVTHARARRPDNRLPRTAAELGGAARLAAIAAVMRPRIQVAADGGIRVAAGLAGSRGGLSELLLIASRAETLGTWSRLKVCSADDCQWAFYDRSPTRNGCWCSMQVCGSRAKSRAYRSRSLSHTS